MRYIEAIPLSKVRAFSSMELAPVGSLLQARDVFGTKEVVIGICCSLQVSGSGPVPYFLTLSGDEVGTLIAQGDAGPIFYDVSEHVDLCVDAAGMSSDTAHVPGRVYEYKPGVASNTFVGAKAQRGNITAYACVAGGQLGVIVTSLTAQYVQTIGKICVELKKPK